MMNRTLLFLLVLASCSPEVGSLTLTRFVPLAGGCGFAGDEGTFAATGTLDVASDRAQYFVGVEVQSSTTLEQPAVIVGGTVLAQPSSDLPQLDTLRFQYRLLNPAGQDVTPPAVRGRTFSQLVSVVWQGPDTEFYRVSAGLLAPEVQPVISDAVDIVTRPEDSYTLEVQVQVAGQLSRSRQAVQTGFSRFPIRLYKTDLGACARVRGVQAPCVYLGQGDSTSVGATQVVPTPPECCDGRPGLSGCE